MYLHGNTSLDFHKKFRNVCVFYFLLFVGMLFSKQKDCEFFV